jgi:hypothetical protein
MDVESLSKKKQTNVQPATEPAPTEPPAAEEQPTPFNRTLIEKEFSKNPLLKGFAKYLSPMLDYFESVEARLQAADLNFQKIGEFLNRMEPLVKLGEQIQQRQTQAQATGVSAPSVSGSDVMGLISQFAPLLMGGGSNPMQDKINELSVKLLDNALQKITQPDSFSKFFEEEVARAKAKAMAAAIT